MVSHLTFTPTKHGIVDTQEAKQVMAEQGYFYTRIDDLTKEQLIQQTQALGSPWKNQAISTIAVSPNPNFVGQTNALIEAHNECAYSVSPPNYLALYCTENDVLGGDFYLVQGKTLLQQLSPELFASLVYTRFRCQVSLSTPILTPLIRVIDNRYRLIYSGLGSLQGESCYELYEAYDAYSPHLIDRLNQYLNDPAYQMRHRWSVGDLIIIDNAAVMHGRYGYEGEKRQLLHLRLQRDD